MPDRMVGYIGGTRSYRNMFENNPAYSSSSELGNIIHDIIDGVHPREYYENYARIFGADLSISFNVYIDVDNELEKLESILQTMSRNNQLLEDFSPEQSKELDSFLCIFKGGE